MYYFQKCKLIDKIFGYLHFKFETFLLLTQLFRSGNVKLCFTPYAMICISVCIFVSVCLQVCLCACLSLCAQVYACVLVQS